MNVERGELFRVQSTENRVQLTCGLLFVNVIIQIIRLLCRTRNLFNLFNLLIFDSSTWLHGWGDRVQSSENKVQLPCGLLFVNVIIRIKRVCYAGKEICSICLISWFFVNVIARIMVFIVGRTQREWVRISRSGYLWRALLTLIGRHASPRWLTSLLWCVLPILHCDCLTICVVYIEMGRVPVSMRISSASFSRCMG